MGIWRCCGQRCRADSSGAGEDFDEAVKGTFEVGVVGEVVGDEAEVGEVVVLGVGLEVGFEGLHVGVAGEVGAGDALELFDVGVVVGVGDPSRALGGGVDGAGHGEAGDLEAGAIDAAGGGLGKGMGDVVKLGVEVGEEGEKLVHGSGVGMVDVVGVDLGDEDAFVALGGLAGEGEEKVKVEEGLEGFGALVVGGWGRCVGFLADPNDEGEAEGF